MKYLFVLAFPCGSVSSDTTTIREALVPVVESWDDSTRQYTWWRTVYFVDVDSIGESNLLGAVDGWYQFDDGAYAAAIVSGSSVDSLSSRTVILRQRRPAWDAEDVNHSGQVDISDLTYLVCFMFCQDSLKK